MKLITVLYYANTCLLMLNTILLYGENDDKTWMFVMLLTLLGQMMIVSCEDKKPNKKEEKELAENNLDGK